jgi:AraC-like DNA-binding protein
VKAGSGYHDIDFERYAVDDHTVFLLRPGQVHQLELKVGSEGFLIEFDTEFYHPVGDLASRQLRQATNKNYCKPEAGKFGRLFSVLEYIFSESAEKEKGYIDVIKANLDIFFIEYNRHCRSLKAIGKNETSYTQERFEELTDLIEKNISTLKQVSQYADLMHLSTYQLNSITKASVGRPASEVITEYILLEAKRYLLATSDQVKEIADTLGYEDISYFIRFFKKHTGYSPESFRQNFK